VQCGAGVVNEYRRMDCSGCFGAAELHRAYYLAALGGPSRGSKRGDASRGAKGSSSKRFDLIGWLRTGLDQLGHPRTVIARAMARSIHDTLSIQLDANDRPMSALCQKETSDCRSLMSALPPKADIGTQPRNVRFVPQADIKSFFRAPWPVGLSESHVYH
jgi:hypothetical protein